MSDHQPDIANTHPNLTISEETQPLWTADRDQDGHPTDALHTLLDNAQHHHLLIIDPTVAAYGGNENCLLYTSPSPRD